LWAVPPVVPLSVAGRPLSKGQDAVHPGRRSLQHRGRQVCVDVGGSRYLECPRVRLRDAEPVPVRPSLVASPLGDDGWTAPCRTGSRAPEGVVSIRPGVCSVPYIATRRAGKLDATGRFDPTIGPFLVGHFLNGPRWSATSVTDSTVGVGVGSYVDRATLAAAADEGSAGSAPLELERPWGIARSRRGACLVVRRACPP
jgi:hypothetical protein